MEFNLQEMIISNDVILIAPSQFVGFFHPFQFKKIRNKKNSLTTAYSSCFNSDCRVTASFFLVDGKLTCEIIENKKVHKPECPLVKKEDYKKNLTKKDFYDSSTKFCTLGDLNLTTKMNVFETVKNFFFFFKKKFHSKH